MEVLIGMNNSIKTRQELEVFYYINLIEKQCNELDIFKKYLLVLYLLKSKNIKSKFIAVNSKTKLNTQIEKYMQELSHYNNSERFEIFVHMYNKRKMILIEPYIEKVINFAEEDIWYEVKKMNNIELGEMLYEKF